MPPTKRGADGDDPNPRPAKRTAVCFSNDLPACVSKYERARTFGGHYDARASQIRGRVVTPLQSREPDKFSQDFRYAAYLVSGGSDVALQDTNTAKEWLFRTMIINSTIDKVFVQHGKAAFVCGNSAFVFDMATSALISYLYPPTPLVFCTYHFTPCITRVVAVITTHKPDNTFETLIRAYAGKDSTGCVLMAFSHHTDEKIVARFSSSGESVRVCYKDSREVLTVSRFDFPPTSLKIGCVRDTLLCNGMASVAIDIVSGFLGPSL